MLKLLAVSLVFTFACSKQSKPEPAAPVPAGQEVAAPTQESEAAPAPTTPATPPAPPAKTKCTESGGLCTSKFATNVCKRSEEGAAWGCAENEHCCIN